MRSYKLMTIVVTLAFSALMLLIAAAQDIEQAAWEKLGIESYHIAVQDAGVWNLVNVEVWVRDGRVQRLEANCEPGLAEMPCYLFTIDASQFEVGELFNRVQAAGERLANVEYDPTYHFPTVIVEDNPQAYDDEHILRVTAFEELSSDETLTATPELEACGSSKEMGHKQHFEKRYYRMA